MTENILNNPGFESGSPDDWKTWATGTTHKYIYPQVGRTGGFSAAIEYPSKELGKIASWFQSVMIDPTKKYKLSGYIKTENIIGKGASIRVGWKDKDWKWLSRSEIMARKSGTIPWTYFEGVVTPDPKAASATIILSIKDCSGKAWFDDIVLSLYSSPSPSHPNIYIDGDDIKAVKDKVQAGQEPWKTAYNDMMKRAEKALGMGLQSVTYGGKTPPSGDKRDYFTENPYGGWKNCSCAQHNKRCSEINCCGTAWCDGKINLDQDRSDYSSAIKVGRSVRDLGVAYAFTGDKKYADKAISFINTWCVNSTTKMNPKFTTWNDAQSRIELTITIPGMFYGADLIWNYPGWNSDNRTTFKNWVADMIKSAKTWSNDNNWENWRLNFIAAGSVITGDSNSLNYVFNKWKELIPIQISSKGCMLQEIHRTKSLFYSMFGINGLTQIAEIARHHGMNLYNYKTADGKGLELAFDFHSKYITDPSKWTSECPCGKCKQISTYKGEGATVYELAYTYIGKKDKYKNCINKWGRPMYEDRNIGPVTLTHGSKLG